MRHLWSLLAGVIAAPLTWVLVSMGQDGSTRTVAGWVDSGRYDTVDLIEPAAYLAVAGVVLGLLGTLRFSPLGPLVAGLLLIGPYAGMFADPFAVRDAVPGDWELSGDPLVLRQPLDNGTLLLLGALLVMATFSVQRWRSWPGAAGTVPEPDSELSVFEAAATPSAAEETPSPAEEAPSAAEEAPSPAEESPPVGEPTPEPAPVDAPAVGARTGQRDSESPWTAPPAKPAGTADS